MSLENKTKIIRSLLQKLERHESDKKYYSDLYSELKKSMTCIADMRDPVVIEAKIGELLVVYDYVATLENIISAICTVLNETIEDEILSLIPTADGKTLKEKRHAIISGNQTIQTMLDTLEEFGNRKVLLGLEQGLVSKTDRLIEWVRLLKAKLHRISDREKT